MKKILGLLLLVSLFTVGIAACTISPDAATGPNQVHLGDISFMDQSITIPKGQPVTLVNDSSSVHIIANGTWKDGVQVPKIEHGAPTINNIEVPGNGNATIGPFTTAGTFLIYCTIHTDMKMTIIVK